jgi:hypothetical protein
MALIELRARKGAQQLGPIDASGDGSGAIRIIQQNGRYKDAIESDRLYSASNQAAQAVSVALATTYTGLMISNPLNSGFRISVRGIGIALTVAPAAIASLHLIGGFSASVNVVHTATLSPISCRLGSSSPAVAKVDSQATIPTPQYLMSLGSGFTAGALYGTTPAVIELDGMFTIDPGGFLGVGALTAVTGIFSAVWEEFEI